MKRLKKVLTGILAATMVFSMGLTAAAAETTTQKATITIDSKNASNANPDAVITYTYYQILKADIVNSDQIAYYVTDDALATAVEGTGYFTVLRSADGSRYNVSLKKELQGKDVETLGKEIAVVLNTDAVKKAAKVTGTFESKNGSATKDLDPGYYLILSSLGTVAAVQTVGEVKINEKNSYPTVTKEDNKEFAQMFDTVVTYTLTVDVPASVAKKDITVVDTATDGLTLDSAVVAKVGETVVGEYKWSAPVDKNGKFEYTTVIPAETVAKYAGSQIVLTYTATVNEKAVVIEPELNSAHLVYDNYNSAETEPVDVRTLGVEIVKIDGTNSKALTGAEFTLWSAKENGNQIAVKKVVVKDEDSDNYRTYYRIAKAGETGENIVVDENGKATIVGLDATKYYLQEEKAPAGYNMIEERFELVINGKNQVANGKVESFDVKNYTGRTLPSTGGIGTTIFYILGGILIIAGVAYFMVRRKADAQA